MIQATKGSLDLDEEDLENIKYEMAKVGRVASQIMELSGQLVEKFKDAALPMI